MRDTQQGCSSSRRRVGRAAAQYDGCSTGRGTKRRAADEHRKSGSGFGCMMSGMFRIVPRLLPVSGGGGGGAKHVPRSRAADRAAQKVPLPKECAHGARARPHPARRMADAAMRAGGVLPRGNTCGSCMQCARALHCARTRHLAPSPTPHTIVCAGIAACPPTHLVRTAPADSLPPIGFCATSEASYLEPSSRMISLAYAGSACQE